MKRYFYLFLLMGVLGVSACTEGDKQQAADDVGKKTELEKAEKVQTTVDDKAATDKKAVEEADKAKPAEGGEVVK